MTLNNERTQPEMVESNLKLLEKGRIDLKDEHTLYKLLPKYVKQIDDENVLFFNKFDEVLLDYSNSNPQSFFNIFNIEEDEEYYKEPKNFDYLFIEACITDDNSIYLYNSFETILDKQYHNDYVNRVRKCIELITIHKCIKKDDMQYFRLKTNYY